MKTSFSQKRSWLIGYALILVVVLTLGIHFSHDTPPQTPVADRTTLEYGATTISAREIQEIQTPEADVDTRDRQSIANQPLESNPVAGLEEPPDDWITCVISETWIDTPQKIADRRRVRIVTADFKYPNIRLEESVTTDPDTGVENVTLLRASVADHLMLGLRQGVDPTKAEAAILEMGYSVRRVEVDSFILAEIPTFAASEDQQRAAIDLVTLEEFIDHAEPDYLVFPCLTPNDPAYLEGKMWGLHNPGTTAGSLANAHINAPEAWQIRNTAPNIIVAVTDTGIQYNHEDLRDNMWTHPVNGTHGYDAYSQDNDPMDIGGHGTHCAGTIGARGNNGTGLTGVAWDVQLMALRFLGPNGGTTSDAIHVINYARNNGAHIINASWGGGGKSLSLQNAIKACGDVGIPFVAAAGNSSANNDAVPHYPSSYNLPNVIAVAATTRADALSSFSCYGRTSVHLGAPGSGIWSTYAGSNTAYTYLNGTSMGAPYVSGALALAMAQFPADDMHALLDRLFASVDPIPALAGKTRTGGRLNLGRLLGSAHTVLVPDNFADAYRFDGHYGSWSGSNFGATREPDENSFSLPNTGVKSLWLAFGTPHAGLVTLDVASDQLLQTLIVFEGGKKGELKVVNQSMAHTSNQRQIRFNSKPDTEYRVLLDAAAGTNQRFWVNYSLSPPNDFFASASPLSGDRFTATGYNRGATRELFENTRRHADVGQGRSVWWTWTAPADLDFTISTAGSDFDTVLAVYTGNSPTSLVEVASNDDHTPLDWTSQVSFAATAGTTYHIAVDSYRSDGVGNITLNGFRSGVLEILRQPASQQAVVGRRAVFDVSVLSGGKVAYQWFFNNNAIPGKTSSNLVLDPVRSEQFGDYHVEVSNSESILISDTAILTERQTAPRLTWTSGNQAVATGTSVKLAATFTGTAPITYSWSKNGIPIHAATTSSLVFTSATVADTGSYRLTTSNAVGAAHFDFFLNVIDSPWDRWEWRRPGVPNPDITDIMVNGTRAYAIAGNAILHSANGENWIRHPFPQGFTGMSVAIKDGTFICIGQNLDRAKRIASSPDGIDWTIHNPTGFDTTFLNYKINVFNSHFIAATGQSSNVVYRSIDGIAWTKIQTTNHQGQVVDLISKGLPATDGNILLMASNTSRGDGSILFHRSGDGITWEEHHVYPENMVNWIWIPSPIVYLFGKFHFFGNRLYTSTDGFHWQFSSTGNMSVYNDTFFAEASGLAYAFRGGALFETLSPTGAVSWMNASPEQSQNITAATTYGDRMIFGTNRGNLKLVSEFADVHFPPEQLSSLNSVEFMEDQFLVRSSTGIYNDLWLSLHSGDGITWKTANDLDVVPTYFIGRAGGRYWGRPHNTNLGHFFSGHNPLDIRRDDEAVTDNIQWPYLIEEAENGSALAIFSVGTNPTRVHHRVNPEAPWTVVNFPITASSAIKFSRFNNRWFTYSTGEQSTVLYSSTNGTSWSSTGITGSNAIFVEHQGALYCFHQTGRQTNLQMRKSTNGGTSWGTAAPTAGLPVSNQITFAKRIVSFGGNLVLLPSSTQNRRIYYSNDGITWIEGYIPALVTDIAVGKGRIVGITSNGGIIEAGAPHPGVNAPQVEITSPPPSGTHLLNSTIMVEGELSDPEDGQTAFEAFLDGVLVASGVGTSFRFPVMTSALKGHTLTVYARDSHGLKQMDSIRLNVVPEEPRNLLHQAEGRNFIPSGLTAVLNGVFYVASSNALYRSLDGITWEYVEIPSFNETIQAIAAGNGALVLQFTKGGIITTRDGVNWTHFQPNQNIYLQTNPIRFENGVFITPIRITSVVSSVMFSENGIDWTVRSTSESNPLIFVVRAPSGIMVGVRGNGGRAERSTNSGLSWQPIDEFPTSGTSTIRGFYANGKFVFVVPLSGKILTSEDSYTWTESTLPGDLGTTATLTLVGDTFFLGDNQTTLYASQDGISWHPTSLPHRPSIMNLSRGVFLAVSGSNLVRSGDGVNWAHVETPFAATDVTKILGNSDVHLIIDIHGATWVSMDSGDTWTPHLPGGALPAANTRIAREVVQLGDTLIAGGNLLVSSDDDGDTWTSITLDGVLPATNLQMIRMRKSAQKVIGFTSVNKVVYTIDGSNFVTISELPIIPWADLSWNGSVWMLLAKDGRLYRSSNDGVTWSLVSETTTLQKGGSITWFNNKWVILGGDGATLVSQSHTYNLTTTGVFTKHAAISMGNPGATRYFNTLVAHGNLVLWESGQQVFVTANGTTWANPSIGLNPSNEFVIYHTPDGFVAYLVSANPMLRYAAKAGPSALQWSSIPAPFLKFTGFHNMGERLFGFAGGVIAEIHPYDLSLDIPSLQVATLGVGDTLHPEVIIRNQGITLPAGSRWAVRAWLSQNRFLGDGKDKPIGTWEIVEEVPLAGDSKNITLSFTLPNEIPTGSNYLILSLVSLDGIREGNKPNNTAISKTAAINIPEWEFSVTTNGNGQVRRDIAATRYPHNAQVSLAATAGKGATFTGWAGDAFSPNNQITILMDGHKSVQANFSDRATLQVFTRGAGDVDGHADLGSYPVDDTAVITAVPAAGWEFSHWSGAADTGDPVATLEMDAPKTITAHFILPMESWRNIHFTPEQLADPEISGNGMDPDGNGIPNWIEYLHGSDPLDKASTGISAITVEGGFLRCIYTRNLGAANGGSVTCQAGRGLDQWDAPDLQERVLSTIDGIETVELRLPIAGGDKGFIRFRYTTPTVEE